MKEKITEQVVDFSNTEIAFSGTTNGELIRINWLFNIMNKPAFTNIGAKLGLLAFKMHLPVAPFVRHNIFAHFCSGRSLEESLPRIEKIWKRNVLSILDYGAEAKGRESDLDETMEENLAAIHFGAENESVAVISTKISGLASNELLQKVQDGKTLTGSELEAYNRLEERLDIICRTAHQKQVCVFIDAEESWIQETIDKLASQMMERYNRDEKVIVYNTFQMYRHDKLAFLKKSHEEAQSKGYRLGAKLVRGAYLEKENNRAKKMGYPTPMQPNKAATDTDYNASLNYCIEHYEEIAFCNASHNEESARYMVELIVEKGLPKDHPHLNFCQLLGMSDHLSFNLAEAGFCVAKYMPYGPVRDVIPYLIRRAQENTAVTGDMSRELGFIRTEMRRRGLLKR
ncbi:MAG: proline dehydrogenase family protein [Bacteroidota bacterium]